MKRRVVGAIIGLLVGGTAMAADFATEMLEATFKLFHQESTATCFFVRRKAPDTGLYLVTAGHVLSHIKGDTAIVVLRQPKDDGSYERHDYTITIQRGGKPLWVQHEKQDIAVLRLSDPPPVSVAALPDSMIADAAGLKAAGVHMCSPLFVFTFPQRFEANAAGFPVARQGIFASPLQLPAQTHPIFLADFTTFSGDSGGPVFVPGQDGHPLLVGIVLSQFYHDEHVKTEYEESALHHPLGLGGILHAQYVLETLGAAAKQNAPPSK